MKTQLPRLNFLRMVSTIICFLMIPQIAFCSNAKQFKELVDDFTFRMTVTWDQTDKEYAQITEHKFREDLNVLIQNGLTINDIKTSFPGAKLEDIEKLALNSSTLEYASAVDYVSKNPKEFYQSGASWNGETFAGIAATIFIPAMLVGCFFLMKAGVNQGCGADRIKDSNGVCQDVIR